MVYLNMVYCALIFADFEQWMIPIINCTKLCKHRWHYYIDIAFIGIKWHSVPQKLQPYDTL